MTQKIFNELKLTYSKLGLGDEILLAHATNLANLGFVTDENLKTVIDAQKDFLEGLQKSNDKRAQDAAEKARKKAQEEYEEETRKKEEEAKKQAEEEAKKKAEEEARKKAEEEEARKKAEEEEAERKRKEQMEKDKNIPDAVKKILAERDEQMKAERTAFEERLKEANERYSQTQADFQKFMEETKSTTQGLLDSYNTMKEEAEKAKAEVAKRNRKDFILNTAKGLNIPQYRIDEGFSISDDMAEEQISEYLQKVANNIKVNNLPKDQHSQLEDDKTPSKEQLEEIAKSLVK